MQVMLRIIALIFFSNCLFAQLPETDLWLFKIKKEKEQLKVAEGKNITSRKGYDNQPYFTPDGKNILYVSVRDEKQSDVFRYDLAKQVSLQVTNTQESEYSPYYTPDAKSISCVTVEADSSQHFWLYNLDGTRKICFDDNIDSIGYYSWLSSDTLLYYKLTAPHSLRRYVQHSKEDKWLCDNPTRAFKKNSGNTFIYGIKDSATVRYRIYNSLIKRSEAFGVHAGSSEDFIWDDKLGLIKSEGNQILRYDEKSKTWNLLFDLAPFNIKKITRFALDPKTKYLVIVDNT